MKQFTLQRVAFMLICLVLSLSLVVSAASSSGTRSLKKRSQYEAAPEDLADIKEDREQVNEGDILYEEDATADTDEWEEEEEDDDDDGSDCDNGNDDDDGSQWHVHDKPVVEDAVDNDQTLILKRPTYPDDTLPGRTTEPFPQWLTDITNLTDWPGQNPPYIQVPGFDLKNIPDVKIRGLGECNGIDATHCSFDCHRCTALDEIHTCPVLSQTFDDGPGPATVRLLDNLPGKTTFFTQGINVIRFPDTFRLQHANGHLLASHTWSHANLAGLPNEEVAAQIQWSIWAMNATAGIIPKYFRPPYGASDNRVRAISRKFGLTSVFWDRDTFDWKVNDKQKTSEEVINDVRRWKEETLQGLLLEHDSTLDVVNVGIDVAKFLAEDNGKQMTVADCVGQKWYQNS